MTGKNAKQHLKDATNHLEDARVLLNVAINSAEKGENKEKIQNSLDTVEKAIQAAGNTLSNYKE